MGLGDDLLFLGEAEDLYKRTGKKITPIYGNGWSSLFNNVEFLTEKGGITLNARDTPGPSDYKVNYYVRTKEDTLLGQRLDFRHYKPKRFKVRVTEDELKYANKIKSDYNLNKFMIINPDYKSTFFSKNKNWGFKKYQEVANALKDDVTLVRLKPGGKYTEPYLENVINIDSPNLRNSIAIASMAHCGLSYDGLMVHILSGFSIPVVNIQGGLVDETIMKYEGNINLSYPHPKTPCGSTYDCQHCADANNSITVEQVIEACRKLL